MRLFSAEKLRAVLKRSKWSKVFLGLALLQLIVTLAFLIPTFLNVGELLVSGDEVGFEELAYKATKICGECILFFALEIWKLWLAIDGVRHTNSRTIWTSAFFSVFSLIFCLLMIIEADKWIKSDREMDIFEEFEKLKYTNMYLLITLSSILFLILPVVFYSVVRVVKDYGWDVYNKIGSDVKIRDMYRISQLFSLALKIEIYFGFCSYGWVFALLLIMILDEEDSPFRVMFSVAATMFFAIIPSLILSRYSISKESRVLMTIFIIFQLLSVAALVYLIVTLKEVLKDWYSFAGLLAGSLIAAIGTTVLAIMCLLNFNKGLKEFVQWKPFSKKKPRQSVTYNNMGQEDKIFGLEDRRIDDLIE